MLSVLMRQFNNTAFFGVLVSLGLLSGCSSFIHPVNHAIEKTSDTSGYRFGQTRGGNFGNSLIILTFSGGGTRAAALSYGVLKELRDTLIDVDGKPVRLLDEVDSISAVSGGSFTAAYFGLFGDQIFTDYKKVFLNQSIQGILIGKLFDPSYWWRSLSTGFDRTEMAIEYYDEHIFKGKTFGDFDLTRSPFIEINATDLGAGNRFSFSQIYFDLICSNLADFKVARAVTASSAVPIMFPTVVLKNYAGACDLSQTSFMEHLMAENSKDPRVAEIQRRISHYLDRENHPYIHLIDGGISDNLGLRALAERIQTYGTGFAPLFSGKVPEHILVISVDAEVRPPHSVDESPEKPSIGEMVESFSDVQLRLYNNETRILLDQKLKEAQEHLLQKGTPIDVYSATVSFSSIRGQSLRDHLNSLPTSLELSPSDVEILERTGGELLRSDKGYKNYLARMHGRRIEKTGQP